VVGRVHLTGRIESIDALRGFNMLWIMGLDSLLISLNIFPGQMIHSDWNGLTFYDTIFPLFVFIAGLSIPLSARLSFRHVVKRSMVLFFLGLVLNGLFNLDFEHLRVMGVLQRISICYFFSAIVYLKADRKRQYLIIASLLVGYHFIMAPLGDFTQEGNFAGYVDRLILKRNLYSGNIDNEGVLSTVPSISTCLLGVVSVGFLKESKLRTLTIQGFLYLVFGFGWSVLFPVNKILWSPSYVLVNAGLNVLLLCAFFFLIDVKRLRVWAFPLRVIGLNSTAIYVAQALFGFWAWSLWIGWVILIKWLFLFYLYRSKIFVRI